MKRIVETQESGLDSLMGEVVTFFCCRYIYAGKLIGVSETCVELEDPKIVYETGPFDEKEWKDAQSLPNKTFFISLNAVESFGLMK